MISYSIDFLDRFCIDWEVDTRYRVRYRWPELAITLICFSSLVIDTFADEGHLVVHVTERIGLYLGFLLFRQSELLVHVLELRVLLFGKLKNLIDFYSFRQGKE